MTIRWGIIGPGAIAHNYADGLAQATAGKLVAIAGRDAARRDAFGDAYAIPAAKRYATYAAIMADPEVDALYISTPHPWHAELSIQAMRAGKHVLCEKPAGMNAAEVTAVTEVAAQTGRFFMEAFMYRCHPQIAPQFAFKSWINLNTINRLMHCIQPRISRSNGYGKFSMTHSQTWMSAIFLIGTWPAPILL